ncbi:DEAD/DEAH box helicase [Candidatus Nitrosocosmicus franklandus]|uniref:ATP-dependent RNA helicase DbpA n=1 Tax=Candidatus Nitrosocosmicus franklandianus TaxID=1798806 RepID=A0A484IK97_9ARCH|nr:DEAD/DEAH box helicase [Candidatus Nitrosocosmicus franklandus]VFJ15329.1 ATP-dependent RNA helicase DbpA [Candidatus Nitrosocosmicus franklandus]
MPPAISSLKFPFDLKSDQLAAVESWMNNGCKGSIIYSTGTGKTEIAFECARKACIKDTTNSKDKANINTYNILFLVPRIVLIEQNITRLRKYNIPNESIGAFYGEKKNHKEITISTYQSTINNHKLIEKARMVILDEVHLLSNTAFSFKNLFKVITSDPKRRILGLTATINERDSRYKEIIEIIPPVKKYLIKEAVDDGRLAKPEIITIDVALTSEEREIYKKSSEMIRNLSYKLNAYDPGLISRILYQGGMRSKYAKEWFNQVKIRKDLLNSSRRKLDKAVTIIEKHRNEKLMVFSETIESITKLREILITKDIKSEIIHSKIKTKERKSILEKWGIEFFPLLSVHTLEIGFDIPQVGIAIILSNTSNINQIAQRIGRVIRKTEEKNSASIYLIYAKETKDNNILRMVDKAVGNKSSKAIRKSTKQTKITDSFE